MKKSMSALALLAAQPKRVSQNYLDTCLKTYTHNHHMRVGETRTGELTMTEENEKFEFVEKMAETYRRNPKVWEGAYINVHLDKNGHYQVHLKKMELRKSLNVVHVAKAIETELRTAKKMLAL